MLLPVFQPRFWMSLGLALFFSFSLPVMLLGIVWTSFLLVAHMPWTSTLGEVGLRLLTQFLGTFGDGQPWQGLLVLGGVAAIVGGLFDTYASTLSRSYD